MERQGDEVHFETDEARGASTPNIMRWVLGISLFAAIALMSAIWIFGAANRVQGDEADEARTRVLQEYGSQGGVLPANGAAEPADTGAETAAPAETAPTPAPAAT